MGCGNVSGILMD